MEQIYIKAWSKYILWLLE